MADPAAGARGGSAEPASTSRTVVFIHGAWMTPSCWDRFIPAFEARGHRTLAPAWPGKDRPIEAIRADPSPLAGLGIREIVDHTDRIVRVLDEPPILVGHSFGGLFVQLLLDRGLGAAGIAIDPAPPKGVFAFHPSAVRALGCILLIPFGWRRAVRWTFAEFRYGFVHTLPRQEARAVYDAYVVPETGRIFFQGAVAMLDTRSPAKIDFRNPAREPLLLIAGEEDHVVPAAAVRSTFRRQRASATRTDLQAFPGRTHWLIAQDGWEEVAEACLGWIDSLGGLARSGFHRTPGPPPAGATVGPWRAGANASRSSSADPRAI